MTAAPSLSKADVDRLTDAAAADPTVFLGLYGRVLDPILGDVPFSLWPHLETLLRVWRRERLSIVLKSRQLGVSWLLAGYALWVAKFQRGANVLVVSKGQVEAAALLAKVKYIESRMPRFLQWERGKDNDSELEFPRRSARIRALPSTKNAGRGEAATLVLLDEFAFHEYGALNYAAIKPTIDAGGRMVIVSTANGFGGPYAKLWSDARSGDGPAPGADGIWLQQAAGPNGFYPVFLDWSCRPGRDRAWMDKQRHEYAPLLLKQEYPADPTEAFIVSGRPVFDVDALEHAFDPIEPYRAVDFADPPAWVHTTGLDVWESRQSDAHYVMGVDVAQGLAHGDASCAVVLDLETGHEVAHLHSQDAPDVFSAKLDALGWLYPGRIAVERAGPGFQVLYKLRELWQPDTPYALYYDTDPLRQAAGAYVGQTSATEQPGWVTDGKSKPLAIGELEAAVRQRHVRIRSRLAYEQMRAYQRDDKGATNAPSGQHDDCVMAWAIAWQMRKAPLVGDYAPEMGAAFGSKMRGRR